MPFYLLDTISGILFINYKLQLMPLFQLFLLIGSWQLIHDENEKLTSQLKDASLDTNLAKDQLDETLLTNITLRQVHILFF